MEVESLNFSRMLMRSNGKRISNRSKRNYVKTFRWILINIFLCFCLKSEMSHFWWIFKNSNYTAILLEILGNASGTRWLGIFPFEKFPENSFPKNFSFFSKFHQLISVAIMNWCLQSFNELVLKIGNLDKNIRQEILWNMLIFLEAAPPPLF